MRPITALGMTGQRDRPLVSPIREKTGYIGVMARRS